MMMMRLEALFVYKHVDIATILTPATGFYFSFDTVMKDTGPHMFWLFIVIRAEAAF